MGQILLASVRGFRGTHRRLDVSVAEYFTQLEPAHFEVGNGPLDG